MADQMPLGSPEHTLNLKLLRVLAANDTNPKLTDWEREWIGNQQIRLWQYDEDTYISYPEGDIIAQIVKKLNVFVPPASANDN